MMNDKEVCLSLSLSLSLCSLSYAIIVASGTNVMHLYDAFLIESEAHTIGRAAEFHRNREEDKNDPR